MTTKANTHSDLYPKTWDSYIGQEDAKAQLRRAVDSAVKLDRNIRHILIQSPYPGIGKTALAKLAIAASHRKNMEISGVLKAEDAGMILGELPTGGILHWEEFHKAFDGGKKHAEWLLPYMEKGELITEYGQEDVPVVTIIATTTDVGTIPEQWLDRFKVKPILEPYNDEQAAEIAEGMAIKILAEYNLPMPSEDTMTRVAQAANNKPRLMQSILEDIQEFVVTGELKAPKNGKYDINEVLRSVGTTHDGLTRDIQKYMLTLFVDFNNRPTGAPPLARRLGQTLSGLAYIEKLLFTKNMLIDTGRGRRLNPAGCQRTRELRDAAALAA